MIGTSLRARVVRAAHDAKLDVPIPNEVNLQALLRIWRAFVRNGSLPKRVKYASLGSGRYGRIEIPVDDPTSAIIYISSEVDRRRQALSLVHEYLHLLYHPNQPEHSGLHALAWILHATIFPNTRP